MGDSKENHDHTHDATQSQALTSATLKVFGPNHDPSTIGVRYIGEYAQASSGKISHYKLTTSEKEVLSHIMELFGGKQVNERDLEFAPEWLTDKVVEK